MWAFLWKSVELDLLGLYQNWCRLSNKNKQASHSIWARVTNASCGCLIPWSVSPVISISFPNWDNCNMLWLTYPLPLVFSECLKEHFGEASRHFEKWSKTVPDILPNVLRYEGNCMIKHVSKFSTRGYLYPYSNLCAFFHLSMRAIQVGVFLIFLCLPGSSALKWMLHCNNRFIPKSWCVYLILLLTGFHYFFLSQKFLLYLWIYFNIVNHL